MKTRWNSVKNMFERLLKLRWPINAVLSNRNAVKPADAKTLEMKDGHLQLITAILPSLQPL